MSVLAHEGTFPILYGTYAVPVGSGFRRGYLARPDQAGRFPVVLVVPGAEGLGSSHKDLCRRLARHGMASVGVDPAENGTGRDLDEAIDFVASNDIDWAIPDQLGVVSFGSGAAAAVRLAAHHPAVRALVMVEASVDDPLADALRSLACPVLGFYGAVDPDAAGLPALPSVSWIVYERSVRGFFDATAEGYSPAAAVDALGRMIGFLEALLPEGELVRLG